MPEIAFAGIPFYTRNDVTYSPDGNWMFVNIQVPGITFAITGPWASLGL